MKIQSPFRMLLKMFGDRFVEDDTVSPGSGFETNIYQVLGFLATVGFFAAYLTMPAFLALSFQKVHTPAGDWALRNFRLFFPALSFAAIGFTTVFQWDMLFPDRRDFLVLTLLPIRLFNVFVAKFAALGLYLVMLIVALNLCPIVGAALFSLVKTSDWGFGVRLVAAQIGATVGASVFAFLIVAAFQGVLITVTSPRIFRRVSPWIQTIGMSLMVLSVCTYPVYILILKSAVDERAKWLWLFPPLWFTGLYDILLPAGDRFFASLGYYALSATLAVLLVFCLAWALGFRRHVRRTLETDETVTRRPRRSVPRQRDSPSEERAIYKFCHTTLARSLRHRLFLATWLSVGIAAGLFVALSVRNGQLSLSEDGLRAFPFLIAFFVISGFRTVFQFPADLACNWILQMTESRWTETARRVARRLVMLSGLLPVLLVMFPFELFASGQVKGLLHILFQALAGAVLIEMMFWKFGKVPFTCSYFAGKTSLSILAALYIYGLTSYSFNMADLEKAAENGSLWLLVFLVAAPTALALFRRRNPEPAEVTFDGSEPFIQTLDLN